MDATTVNERDVYHTASQLLVETFRQKIVLDTADVSKCVSVAVALRDEVWVATARDVEGRYPRPRIADGSVAP